MSSVENPLLGVLAAGSAAGAAAAPESPGVGAPASVGGAAGADEAVDCNVKAVKLNDWPAVRFAFLVADLYPSLTASTATIPGVIGLAALPLNVYRPWLSVVVL